MVQPLEWFTKPHSLNFRPFQKKKLNSIVHMIRIDIDKGSELPEVRYPPFPEITDTFK